LAVGANVEDRLHHLFFVHAKHFNWYLTFSPIDNL
jgi:hypothetical protein